METPKDFLLETMNELKEYITKAQNQKATYGDLLTICNKYAVLRKTLEGETTPQSVKTILEFFDEFLMTRMENAIDYIEKNE